MGKRKVEIVATEGLFRGLARQNMLFHECIGELVDNAIAATSERQRFEIHIVFESNKNNQEFTDVWIADNSSGMDSDHLEKALQPGESATKENRLNEHGFGLKNALATLSADDNSSGWQLWTKPPSGKTVCSVKGPFGQFMTIEDIKTLPKKSFIPSGMSTIIKVSVKTDFIRTVQGRGQPTKDLSRLKPWLLEHLGVHYRGYLEPDPETNEPSGKMFVGIGNKKNLAKPIHVPMVSRKTERFKVELGGEECDLEYRHGVLDEQKAKHLKFYYKNNIATQGIDIRLGKRVIITRQLKTIWDLERDNHFNHFVGELRIPEPPRGILTTKNDKTDFNLNDPEWQKIFESLREYPPIKDGNRKSEKELKEKWKKMLESVTGDKVITETKVWETAVKIDIYQKAKNGDITIYEVKVGAGTPLDLYQLKMYWDGLVLMGEKPAKAVLLVERFSEDLKKMAVSMNEKLPQHPSAPYKFEIETLENKGIVSSK